MFKDLLPLIIVLVVILGGLFFSLWKADEPARQYGAGQISLQEYCDIFKTSRNPPADCYTYFSVKPVGSDTNCTPINTGKTTSMSCSTTTILQPNN